MQHTAILIPPCDRYAPLTTLTVRWMDESWAAHPAVYSCGSDRVTAAEVLRSAADPADWIGIARDAVRELAGRGVEWVYVLLDDHPPVDRCNGEFLSRALPLAAESLSALHIGLSGWDQFRPCPGDDLGPDRLHLRRIAPSFRWRFTLHPGLWNVRRFETVLTRLADERTPARSARDFEGRMNASPAVLPEGWGRDVYRIAGNRYAAGTAWIQGRWTRPLFVAGVHARRWIARRVGGASALERTDAALSPFTNYLNGPYPMVWSGLMQRGRPNPDALALLRALGRAGRAAEVEKVFGEL